MDILKKLEIEIDGIIGTIESYTGEPYINNILIKLKKSINSRDALEIKYCLTKLSEWYSDNQKYIQNNKNDQVSPRIFCENVVTESGELDNNAGTAKNRAIRKE